MLRLRRHDGDGILPLQASSRPASTTPCGRRRWPLTCSNCCDGGDADVVHDAMVQSYVPAATMRAYTGAVDAREPPRQHLLPRAPIAATGAVFQLSREHLCCVQSLPVLRPRKYIPASPAPVLCPATVQTPSPPLSAATRPGTATACWPPTTISSPRPGRPRSERASSLRSSGFPLDQRRCTSGGNTSTMPPSAAPWAPAPPRWRRGFWARYQT